MLHHLARELCRPSAERPAPAYEALDTTALPVRNVKRRGAGHLAGRAEVGHSRRLGWYEGFHLLVAVDPVGVVTGFALGGARAKEQTLCEAFLEARALYAEDTRRATALGVACAGCPVGGGAYLADNGFEGEERQARWRSHFGADVVTPPKRSARRRRWSKALRRQMVRLRQVAETVIGHLQEYGRLQRDRPHSLAGLWVRVASTLALHNARIWINRALGRPDLVFAEQAGW